ncbi:MAG: hypothetical protein AAF693_06285 [Bacteroidota bacterium]
MNQKTVNLYHISFEAIFEWVKNEIPRYHYDLNKHSIFLESDDHERMGYIRLPLHITIEEPLLIRNTEAIILYLTIESGNAAMSVMKGKNNLYHTTFSAYMTRKRQGFSQVKYLNKKGKSRAGSRVRLAATMEFFENINMSCANVLEIYEVERIALNCSSTLLPYLYQSKVPCSFTKKDPRLYKIPLYLPKSNFSHLEKAIKKLMAPILIYDEKYSKGFNELIERTKL